MLRKRQEFEKLGLGSEFRELLTLATSSPPRICVGSRLQRGAIIRGVLLLRLVLFMSLVIAVRGAGLVADYEGGAGGMGRWFSTEVRQLEQQRESLARELAWRSPRQPAAVPGRALASAGAPGALRSADETVWVQVDLGTAAATCMLLRCVPANGAAQDAGGAGYGFPVRLRIEVSDDETFAQREIVADHTAVDVAFDVAWFSVRRFSERTCESFCAGDGYEAVAAS